jgi:acetylornithine deacetylase/succinyl-diaminopimelate desuccinylase-like protein
VRRRWQQGLGDLIAQPTIAGSPRHRRALEHSAVGLCRYLRRLGLGRTQVLRAGAGTTPSVWAEWRCLPQQPTVLVYGHFDVQPPGAHWPGPDGPFTPVTRGGRIHGRGASDDKGPLWAMLCGLESILATAKNLPVNVRVWIEGEEELGSPHLDRFLDRYHDLLRADVLVLSDNPRALGGQVPSLVAGLRGMVDAELTIEGQTRPLHTGNYGGEVANPALALASMLATLVDGAGTIAIPGFYRRVRPVHPTERASVARARPAPARLGAAAGVTDPSQLRGEHGWQPGERSLFRPSLDVTSLVAGGAGPNAVAAIPAIAQARLNIRLVPDQRPAEVVSILGHHLQQVCPPGMRCRLRIGGAALPVRVPLNHPLVTAARHAAAATWHQPPMPLPSGGTIAIVAALHRLHRTPAAMIGLSRPEDHVHGPGESFPLAELYNGAEFLTRYLYQAAR